MMLPEIVARRFWAACMLGCGLGLLYGFLRPLRPRLTHLTDGVFVIAAGWSWLVLSFGICHGDLRLGYSAGLAIGAFFWELTVGKLLRPVFWGFWRLVGKILVTPWRLLRKIFQKTGVFVKKLFAFGKKSGTIKWKNHRHNRRKTGGNAHGTAHEYAQSDPAGL